MDKWDKGSIPSARSFPSTCQHGYFWHLSTSFRLNEHPVIDGYFSRNTDLRSKSNNYQLLSGSSTSKSSMFTMLTENPSI